MNPKGRLKRLLLPQRPRVRTLPIGAARGIRLEIDFARQTRLYLGLYETEIVPHVRRFCRDAVDCFDVGGNVGYDALLLAKLAGGRVISFESDAHLCRQIAANIAANQRLGDRVSVRNARVAAQTDREAGHVALDDVGADADAFVPGLIKIDVDGSEVGVLRGAERILGSRKPHLIVETHAPELELACRELLVEAGYDPVVVPQRRLLHDHRPLAFNRWLIAEGR